MRTPNDSESRNRQEQIMYMAAEGMTDKEIAMRLNLSPETVGTYWRRILAKYSAASRTEVVAKVMRLQAKATMDEANELNKIQLEINEHLLIELAGRGDERNGAATPRAILEALPDVVLFVDPDGVVQYTNASSHGLSLTAGDRLDASFDHESLGDLVAAIARAQIGETPTAQVKMAGRSFSLRAKPFGADGSRSIVAVLRQS